MHGCGTWCTSKRVEIVWLNKMKTWLLIINLFRLLHISINTLIKKTDLEWQNSKIWEISLSPWITFTILKSKDCDGKNSLASSHDGLQVRKNISLDLMRKISLFILPPVGLSTFFITKYFFYCLLWSCIALIFVLVEISIVLFAWKAHVFELTAALLALVLPFLAHSWFLHMSTHCMFFFVHSCLSSLCSDNFEYKCCPSVCLQPLQTQYCLNSLCSP